MKLFLETLCNNLCNKYQMQFTVSTLVSILEQGFRHGVPSCISHNYLNPHSWIIPCALYLNHDLAEVIGKVFSPSNHDDEQLIRDMTNIYIRQNHFSIDSKIQREFVDDFNCLLSENAFFCQFDFIGVYDNEIVFRAFPHLKKLLDADGLIPLHELNSIAPGVFDVSSKYAILASSLFRRSQSLLNTLNQPFFKALSQVKDNKSIRIAIEPNLIVLRNSIQDSLELNYWWGPKFNNLLNIQYGETVHCADIQTRKFNSVVKHDFYWHEQDGYNCFECEEVIEKPTGTHFDTKDQQLQISVPSCFGCRYIHSLITADKTIVHCDGAIRTYNEDDMLLRFDQTISTTPRQTDYKKLWRIDGDISLASWKELITHFYRDNHLPGEYFVPVKDIYTTSTPIPVNNSHKEKHDTKKIFKTEFYGQDELKAAIAFLPSACYQVKNCISINVRDSYIDPYKISHFCIELETIDFLKFLTHNHIAWRFNKKRQSIHILDYQDICANIPLIILGRSFSQADRVNLKNTLIQYISSLGSDFIRSFSFALELEDRFAQISFSGAAEKLRLLFSESFFHFPDNIASIKKLTDRISSKLSESKPDKYYDDWKQYLPKSLDLKVRNYPRGLIAPIDMSTAMIFIVDRTLCKICQNDYLKCKCLPRIDKPVAITKARPLAVFATPKALHAYPDVANMQKYELLK